MKISELEAILINLREKEGDLEIISHAFYDAGYHKDRIACYMIDFDGRAYKNMNGEKKVFIGSEV